jgi:superfamily II DNA or RNA helicase
MFGWEFKGSRNDIARLHKEIIPRRGARMAIKDLGNLFPENQLTAELYKLPYENEEAIQEIYCEMEEELNDLGSRENQGSNLLVYLLRARQKVELEKIPAVVEITNEYLEDRKNVVIFVNFDATIEALASRLNTTSVIRGGQNEETRTEIIQKFQRDETHIIICNIQAGGVGISLHDKLGNYPRVSLILPSFSAQYMVQAIGRIWRAGAKSKAQQRIIFAADTIEDQICHVVRKKIENINLLNDGDLTSGIQIKPEIMARLTLAQKKEIALRDINNKENPLEIKVNRTMILEDKEGHKKKETFNILL